VVVLLAVIAPSATTQHLKNPVSFTKVATLVATALSKIAVNLLMTANSPVVVLLVVIAPSVTTQYLKKIVSFTKVATSVATALLEGVVNLLMTANSATVATSDTVANLVTAANLATVANLVLRLASVKVRSLVINADSMNSVALVKPVSFPSVVNLETIVTFQHFANFLKNAYFSIPVFSGLLPFSSPSASSATPAKSQQDAPLKVSSCRSGRLSAISTAQVVRL
jgi:hypothetical protein